MGNLHGDWIMGGVERHTSEFGLTLQVVGSYCKVLSRVLNK